MTNMTEAIHLCADDPTAWLVLRDYHEEFEIPFVQPSLTNSIGMKMMLIPPGKFLMGSPETEKDRNSNEGPQHEVEIEKSFYLGAFPVTQAEYSAVMGTNPSHFCSTGDGAGMVEGMDTSNFPVEQVSWNDAVEFCRRLSKKEGRKYRLPSESQWEYACRAGTTTPFSFGKSLSSLQANFDGNYPYGGAEKGPYLKRTSAVGSYPANAFGLFDMHGNVWEWCQDQYKPYKEASTEASFELSEEAAGLTTDGSADQHLAAGVSQTTSPRTTVFESPAEASEEAPFELSEEAAGSASTSSAAQPSASGMSRRYEVGASDSESLLEASEEVPFELSEEDVGNTPIVSADQHVDSAATQTNGIGMVDSESSQNQEASEEIPFELAEEDVGLSGPSIVDRHFALGTLQQSDTATSDSESLLEDSEEAPFDSLGAAAGTVVASTAGRPPAAGSGRRTGSTSWASGSPSLPAEASEEVPFAVEAGSTLDSSAEHLYVAEVSLYSDTISSALESSQSQINSARVLRGGSWSFAAWFCRSAFRFWRGPDDRIRRIGFRVALV